MTTGNEALRKRAEELLKGLWAYEAADCDRSFYLDVNKVIAFAAEQAALARQVAIAEAVKVCRNLVASMDNPYNLANHQVKSLQEPYIECAEAIARLSPAGERVMVPTKDNAK